MLLIAWTPWIEGKTRALERSSDRVGPRRGIIAVLVEARRRVRGLRRPRGLRSGAGFVRASWEKSRAGAARFGDVLVRSADLPGFSAGEVTTASGPRRHVACTFEAGCPNTHFGA